MKIYKAILGCILYLLYYICNCITYLVGNILLYINVNGSILNVQNLRDGQSDILLFTCRVFF